MTTTTFNVLHLDCSSCAMVMEGIMEDMAGVTSAEVHVAQRTLVVKHDEAVRVDDMVTALTREGYPVETQTS